MKRLQRTVTEIDINLTTGIVFLLMVFFIVITSVNPDQGLERRLPPAIGKYAPISVEPRNVLNVLLTDNDELVCGNQIVGIGDLRELAKQFISNPQNDPKLPEKEVRNVNLLGKMAVTSKHVISVQCGRETTYQAYIDVQNELIGAYNELRNELAQKKWNKKYMELTPEQQKAVNSCYRICISEAEPLSRKGGGR